MQGNAMRLLAMLSVLALGACGPAGGDDDTWAADDDDDPYADLDGDGIRDQVDEDIDGDGALNGQDLDPRNPTVGRGTGTIAVTYTMLAALADGQTVEPEIVIAEVVRPDWPPTRADLEPTGVIAPGTIEVYAATYIVSLTLNEPNAPVAERFYAMDREVVVERGRTSEVALLVGRDLTGTWVMEEAGPWDEPIEVEMITWPTPNQFTSPCETELWALHLGLCLIEDDHLWWSSIDDDMHANGEILNGGLTVQWTQNNFDGDLFTYTYHREE